MANFRSIGKEAFYFMFKDKDFKWSDTPSDLDYWEAHTQYVVNKHGITVGMKRTSSYGAPDAYFVRGIDIDYKNTKSFKK